MKMRVILVSLAGALFLGLVGYRLVSSQVSASAADFPAYLIPTKMDALFFEKKVTVFLTTKAVLPGKPGENSGWMVGLDTDSNRETGGKWPKIGADYILSVINQAGKWNVSLKNVKTGNSRSINGEVMVEKNKVDFSIPLNELENKTVFVWQIAVVNGEKKEALPEVRQADQKEQKAANYDDYMNKNMKM